MTAPQDDRLPRHRIARENAERRQAEAVEAELVRIAKSRAEHRQRVHREAKESLVGAGFNANDARQIVELVRDGSVAHIRIDY